MKKKKQKWYAVKKGLVPGIYRTWEACKENVDGYPDAKYRSFKSEQEAIDYMDGKIVSTKKQEKNARRTVVFQYPGNFRFPEKVDVGLCYDCVFLDIFSGGCSCRIADSTGACKLREKKNICVDGLLSGV